ncbi:MAG: type II CAAX endopeptidase family protein [Chloroflexota bacterium]
MLEDDPKERINPASRLSQKKSPPLHLTDSALFDTIMTENEFTGRGVMHLFVSLFWNRQQHRLRTAWRLILQLGVFAGLALLAGFPVSLLQKWFFQLSSVALSDAYAVLLSVESTLNWLLLLFSLWLAARLLDRRPFRAFGFHLNGQWWADLAFGLLLGAVLMAAIFIGEFALGWVTVTGYRQTSFQSFTAGVVFYIFHYIAVGIQEESLSRGYWLRNLAEGFHLPRWGARTALWLAYALSSSIFGLLHFANPNASLISTLNLIVAGFMLGLPYVLTGQLAASIGLHITWNFFQGVVFGLPVSGLGAATSFLVVQQGGPAVWTGGSFGPEAGLIGLLAMLAGAVLIPVWVKATRGKVEMQDELAVYSPPQQKLADDHHPSRA